MQIECLQYSDGRPTDRGIYFKVDSSLDADGLLHDDLDAHGAHIVGTLPIEAAEDLDRLNGDAPP